MRNWFWCLLILVSAGASRSQTIGPCLPAPILAAMRNPPALALNGVANMNYAIERTFDLRSWERWLTNRSASGVFSMPLTVSDGPAAYFRALEVSSLDGRGAFWIFDGATLAGWIPDSAFRVEDCALAGGSLSTQLSENHFLSTSRLFTNFVLRLKFKLVGVDGFINAGVQFRSVRQSNGRVSGYQADIGDGFWGSLYDESRRNVVLAAANQNAVLAVLKTNDWNDYRILAEGSRIRLFINELPTVDFVEHDETIARHGIVALQIHGGTRAIASYKEILVEELE